MTTIYKKLLISIDKAYLYVLHKIYKFNYWHVTSPISARMYRHNVADIVNKLNPNFVIEVGCGLGLILKLINASLRHGYDLDPGVISAAKFLHRNSIVFNHGDLTTIRDLEFDVLILVNWIHDINADELNILITPILPHIKYLVLDAIDRDQSVDYRYKHDFSFLKGRATMISVTRAPNEGRSFQLFEVCK